MLNIGGRALDGQGGLALTDPNQTPNADIREYGSRTTGDEFRSQEGKSPDHRLRSPNSS